MRTDGQTSITTGNRCTRSCMGMSVGVYDGLAHRQTDIPSADKKQKLALSLSHVRQTDIPLADKKTKLALSLYDVMYRYERWCI
jgi:hypothetical protein